jgi:AAA+ ATPase superfamily predicted ATPase
MATLIGRDSEISILKEGLKNNKSELIAIYGRRRVGKTFLVRQFYTNNIVFEVTGLFNGGMRDQIQNFEKELRTRSKKTHSKNAETWFEAFSRLEAYIDALKLPQKKVVFIDEFPWLATAKSKFLMAFENFWNSYCTKRDDVIVVICGSAASYMVQKVIKNKGGLHNRISRKIRLLPFNLYETDLFLKSRGINYTDFDTIQVYLALGGVPHYLEKLQKGLSVSQNIDRLCFDKDGVLNDEFNQLYASLFDNSERHMQIIRTLAKTNKGITRKDLIAKTGFPSGGDFSLKLEELIESGFVSEYTYYQNKKQLSLYRLSDEYSKFYLKFIEGNRNNGDGTWQRLSVSQSYVSWAGFAFETLCLKHIHQIKKALRIDAIYSTNSSWFNDNAQIDLLIDRADNVMNLCEMKFYNVPFTIDKTYYLNLKNKRAELLMETKTKKNVFITLITTYGIKENEYSNELVQSRLDMRSLFTA